MAGETTLPPEEDISDPKAVRPLSILPEEDADQAYCVRHDREMKGMNPPITSNGALYTTSERFKVYTCPDCLAETDRERERADGLLDVFERYLYKAFTEWDEGDADGDWFQYVGEE
jgi:hypothetical protein